MATTAENTSGLTERQRSELEFERVRAEIRQLIADTDNKRAESERWIDERKQLLADAEHKRAMTNTEQRKTLAAVISALSGIAGALAGAAIAYLTVKAAGR